MTTYSAVAYTDGAQDPQYHLDQLPDRWALRIDLTYRNGGTVVLIYPEGQPPAEKEHQDLMRELQIAARSGAFTILYADAAGTRALVPALGRKNP